MNAALPFEIVDDNTRLLARLAYLRDRLVLKTEEVSIKLEANMNPGVAASLRGGEQRKAARLFEVQARKLEAELNKLMTLAENFRVHIY